MGVLARPFGSKKNYREKCIEKWKIQQPCDCVIEKGKDWWNSKDHDKNREKRRKHPLNIFSKQLGVGNNEH